VRPGTKHRHTIFDARGALCGFHKKRAGAHYTKLVFLHPVGYVGRIVHYDASGVRNVIALFFHARVGWVCFPQKARRDMLRQTLVFASGGIC
jgi:hypothetical protein